MNVLCSMIRSHERWVSCGSRFESYKNDWSLLEIRKSSKILTHRAVLAVPTFRIKLLSPRVPESQAANRECSEIHERIWEFPQTCPTSAWGITQWFKKFGNTVGNSEKRRNWEKWERRTIATNTFTLLSGKSKRKVWTTEIILCLWPTAPRVSGLALKVAWQFRVFRPWRCVWGKSLTTRNFTAGL